LTTTARTGGTKTPRGGHGAPLSSRQKDPPKRKKKTVVLDGRKGERGGGVTKKQTITLT